MDNKTENRFFSKVDCDIPNGCWEWTASTNKDGYGQFSYEGIMYLAHRISYEYFYGTIPDGLIVRHKVCHNPLCVNPLHLELGNQKDNIGDRDLAGRQAKGERHGNSILTENNVEVIRHLCKNKDIFHMTQKEIADSFGISQHQVYQIVKGKNWRS